MTAPTPRDERPERPSAFPYAVWASVALLSSALTWGCAEFRFEGFLSEPITVGLPDDTPVIEIGRDEQQRILATIDSGSALTVIFEEGSGSRSEGDLFLREQVPPARQEIVGKEVVTRFVLRDVEVFDLRLAPVGLAPDPIEIEGILGANVLSRFAVSLDYHPEPGGDDSTGSFTLRDEKSGTSDELAEDCDLCDLLKEDGFFRQRCNAVIRTRQRGGGEMVLAGKEHSVSASRLVVSVCALPADFDPSAPAPPTASTTGTPMAGLISTGIGVSVMARSAFERLRLQDPTIEEEEGYTLHLPYGEESASLTRLTRVALVSNETNELGPCSEIARRRRMLVADLEPDDANERGAAIALARDPNEGILFAVIADESDLFQGLRQELRPETADVDLLLGGSLLRFFDIDLDYPAERTVLRCAEQTAGHSCETVPHCDEGGTPPCSDTRGLSDQPC